MIEGKIYKFSAKLENFEISKIINGKSVENSLKNIIQK